MSEGEQQKFHDERVAEALSFVLGGVPDGDHHKAWMIDQIVRILTGCQAETVALTDCNGIAFDAEVLGANDEYFEFLRQYSNGEDGPHTYTWDVGIPP